MYNNTSPKQDESYNNRETVEQFLARGGTIEKKARTASGKRPPRKKTKNVDAQALLNKALGTPYEKQVVNFLKSQGIEVYE